MVLTPDTIEQFRSGDMSAFEKIYEAEHVRLGRFVLRYIRSQELAEDILQEVWIRVWNCRGQIQNTDRFTSWFYQVARSRIVEKLRSEGRKIEFVLYSNGEADENEKSLEMPDPRPGPRDNAALTQWTQKINNEMKKLDPQMQEILALRFGAGLNLREISEALCLPLGTVCSGVSRTLRQMKKNLIRQGFQWEP